MPATTATIPQELLDALSAAEEKLSAATEAQAALDQATGAAQEAAGRAESARHVRDVALDASHQSAQETLAMFRRHFGLDAGATT